MFRTRMDGLLCTGPAGEHYMYTMYRSLLTVCIVWLFTSYYVYLHWYGLGIALFQTHVLMAVVGNIAPVHNSMFPLASLPWFSLHTPTALFLSTVACMSGSCFHVTVPTFTMYIH